MAYCFGIYHWRRRLRSLLVAAGVSALALWVGMRGSTRESSRVVHACCLVAVVRSAVDAGRTVSGALSPPPWVVERYKYDALAARLPLGRADRVLDVGCGTGRSLVGLAPHLGGSTTLLGLDVFDDRVILGNGPALARRNAALAGVEVTPLQGDAARPPVAANTIDIVTACRVLHDLPPPDADRALGEFARVCAPDGTVGVLELPLTPDEVDADPAAYWRERTLAAGLEIERLDRVDRCGAEGRYVVIVATPVAE
jgi:SAM-dependent methyltransferase